MLGDGSPFEFAPRSGHESSASRGVLCIHGFTGTPFEMRYLGEALVARGFHVLGPVLPGHGTTPENLDQTTWLEWYGAVEAALDRLLERCDKVGVVGQSLGGLLALRLAQERQHQVSAVASLATPLWLPWPARAAARATKPGSLLGRAIQNVPKLGGSDVRDLAMKRKNPAYMVVPVRPLHQLMELMEIVRAHLAEVRAPILVVHGRQDHTVPYACSEELLGRVTAEIKLHRALEQSFHLVSMDVERGLVAADVGDFFEAQLGASSKEINPS